MCVAGAADEIAHRPAIPLRAVLLDDGRWLGVSCTVRCGCEAERKACAERGLDDDEGDGAWLGMSWLNGLDVQHTTRTVIQMVREILSATP